MFKKLPFFLLFLILSVLFVGPYIPLPVQSFFYALSLSLKTLLVFFLPILIFLLLYKTTSQLAKGASSLLLFILAAVVISNFASTWVSYCVGKAVYQLNLHVEMPQALHELVPLWTFSLPKWVPNNIAMLLGLVSGLLLPRISQPLAHMWTMKADKIVSAILKGFMILLPFFITGFVLKLGHDGILAQIIKDYALIFSIVALSQACYIFLLQLAIHKFQIQGAVHSIKNLLPAATVGFGSMSSAAAMPLTLVATGKNAQNADVARSVIPVTVNIHLIGDCLAIPIFAFAILKHFGLADPSFFNYLTFAFYFVLAKFSVAAIPGGGIIVMLPIIESSLGFSPEMLSLITALYILFDPVITSANVLGNGTFAELIEKSYSKLFSKKKSKEVLNTTSV